MAAFLAASAAVRGRQLVNTLGYTEHTAVHAFDGYINQQVSAFSILSQDQMYHFGHRLQESQVFVHP